MSAFVVSGARFTDRPGMCSGEAPGSGAGLFLRAAGVTRAMATSYSWAGFTPGIEEDSVYRPLRTESIHPLRRRWYKASKR